MDIGIAGEGVRVAGKNLPDEFPPGPGVIGLYFLRAGAWGEVEYTLDEAKSLLKRRDCAGAGHECVHLSGLFCCCEGSPTVVAAGFSGIGRGDVLFYKNEERIPITREPVPAHFDYVEFKNQSTGF